MSGKQARRRRQQQVAAPPPVMPKGARRRASPKVLVTAGLIGLVLAAAAVGIALAFGGGSSSAGTTPSVGTLTNALPGAAAVQKEFAGIPQRGTFLGLPKAPVTMIEYIDLQCSACQLFETQTMPSIIRRYVKTGKLRVEARPIVAIGPDSERGVLGSLAAARQNRLYNFAQILYYNQGPENGGWLTGSMVKTAAASVPGLKVPAFEQAYGSSAVRVPAKRISEQATADNVKGTPTLLVGKTGGKLHEVSPGVVPNVPTLASDLDRALR